MPDGCDLVAAGALPVAFGTSHVALVHRAQLTSGQVGTPQFVFCSFPSMSMCFEFITMIASVLNLEVFSKAMCGIFCRCCWFLVQLEGLVFLLFKLARFAGLLLLQLQGTYIAFVLLQISFMTIIPFGCCCFGDAYRFSIIF